MFDFLDEVGLTSEMVTADARAPRYICIDQQLRRVPFGPLTATGLLRMMREPFVGRGNNPDETVKDFFVRRVGQEAHDRLAAPFVTGIYAGDTGQLSMRATFPKLAELERDYGSIMMGMLRSRKKKSARKGHLSSFRQGMETLPQRIAKDLDIQFNVSEARVGREAKAVVLTVPAHRAVEVLELQEPAISHLLGKVEYAPMVVAITSLPDDAFPQPLRGFGFLVPRTERLHLLGTIFSSTLFPNRAPQGRTLLTSYIGGAFEPEAMDWPDGRVWEVVCSELKKVLHTSVQPDPVAIFRHRRAIPQYKVGHGRWVEALKGEMKKSPGLFVAGNFIDGVSVPACIENGVKTAHAVSDFLKKQ
jgi:oxygen-dependent protoporphyrinogen oxidase